MSQTRTPGRRHKLISKIETVLMIGFAALVVIHGSMAVAGIIGAIGRMFLIMLRG